MVNIRDDMEGNLLICVDHKRVFVDIVFAL